MLCGRWLKNKWMRDFMSEDLAKKEIKLEIDKIREKFKNKELTDDVIDKSAKNFSDIIKKYSESEIPDIVWLSKELGFDVYNSDDLPEDISGIINVNLELEKTYGSSKVIMLSSKVKVGKQRFVLAHELAHYIIELDENNLPYMSAYKNSNNEKSEDDANRFAATILMPKEDVKKEYEAIKAYCLPEDIPIELSEKFKVTPKSMKRRLKELKLI